MCIGYLYTVEDGGYVVSASWGKLSRRQSFIIIIVVLPAAPLCIDNFVPGIYGQSMSGYAPASLTYRPMARVVN